MQGQSEQVASIEPLGEAYDVLVNKAPLCPLYEHVLLS